MITRYLTIAGVLTLAAAIGFSACFDPREGYAPEQPIPFSHEVHSGVNEIPCGYCHTEPGEGPHSSVPSLDTCMSCHGESGGVAQQSEDIQQLQEHWESGDPIEWVKVHDLPDHAQFSHQPHIQRGIDCSECHGQVNRMDKVEVTNEFNMGWCIDCHRDPEHNASIDCVTCHY